MTRSFWTRGARWAPCVLAAVALTLTWSGPGTPRARSAAAAHTVGAAGPAVGAARRLSLRSTARLRQIYPGLMPAQARSLARRRMHRIPLPHGGSFEGIRWEQAQGSIAPGQVEQTLQYNARCQWLRAARDGRESATASSVVELTRRWPALRGVVDQIPPGQELASCDASHLREIEFEQSRGVAPSS